MMMMVVVVVVVKMDDMEIAYHCFECNYTFVCSVCCC